MARSEADGENDRLWRQLEIVKLERGVDTAMAGYARLHVLMLALSLVATFLPWWEVSSGGKPVGDLWYVIDQSGEVHPMLIGLGVLAAACLVLMIWVVLSPRGVGKPVAITFLTLALAAGLVDPPGLGRFHASGAIPLLACFGFIIALSVAHGIHARIAQNRIARVLSASSDEED